MTIRNLTLTLAAWLLTLLFLPISAAAQSSRNVKAKFTWSIGSTEHTTSLTLMAMVPVTIEGRQKVDSVQFSIKPTDDFTDERGNRYVNFEFTSPNIPQEIVIQADIQLLKHGLNSSKLKNRPAPSDLSNYLGDEQFLNMGSDVIKLLARSLRGKSYEETVDNIIKHISGVITYNKSIRYNRQGTLVTIEKKAGVCGDYSDLMIALCRANGIPARHSGGYFIDSDFLPGWDGDSWHVWVEAYLQGYGWVNFEPTTSVHKGWRIMSPTYIYLSTDIYNSLTNGIYTYRYKGWRPRIDNFFSVK